MRSLLTYLRTHHQVALLALLSAVSMILLGLRIIFTWNETFIFMTWNLFLAWVPLLFIKMIWEIDRRKSLSLPMLTVALVFWLLFFPNAPYIVTDLKHLKQVPDYMLWYDALMIFTFAVSGLLTGLYSIRIAHRLIRQRGNALISWFLIGASMVASGYGVFLGRYGRWNSWDIVSQPGALAKAILTTLREPFAIKHTLAFSFVLMLMYLAFHIFAEIRQHERARQYS